MGLLMNGTCKTYWPALEAESKARGLSVAMFNMQARECYSVPTCFPQADHSFPASAGVTGSSNKCLHIDILASSPHLAASLLSCPAPS